MVYMKVRKVGHKHFMYTTMDVLFVAYFIDKKSTIKSCVF